MTAENDRYGLPPFDMKCAERSQWDDDAPSVVAMFYVDGRPCGKVARMVEVLDIPMRPTHGEDDASVQIGRNGLPPADLTVTIVADPENDGRHYWCSISTPRRLAYPPIRRVDRRRRR
ncbi:hypothetical protein CQ12_40345 [Bradyrhizobium jicamae]|uniref:Uncharacterized protein n=1 Tax=Bradyrhizobium jicamae TaxID=280332 RepID=A0A0R3M4R2_9BRAD|nr:hypothetical protein [Bradyrhizobium jicamae]KRR15032.1 hypothetical protein CQ12_40345 [Bradyrhizobium jicamae]